VVIKLKSALIAVSEEYLSKGIALALLDQFQSINSTRNPFEALSILNDRQIDLIITEVLFSTIEPDEYLKKLVNNSQGVGNIIVLKDSEFKVEEYESQTNLVIQQKPISIKNIINIIELLII
jgi:PleD family two-component response regulator